VPVLLFVGEILGVCSYEFCAFFAGVGEKLFVASDAVRMFFSQDISLAREILVAVPTGKMLRVKFFVHGSCILAGENQLRSRLDAFFPLNHDFSFFSLRTRAPLWFIFRL